MTEGVRIQSGLETPATGCTCEISFISQSVINVLTWELLPNMGTFATPSVAASSWLGWEGRVYRNNTTQNLGCEIHSFFLQHIISRKSHLYPGNLVRC